MGLDADSGGMIGRVEAAATADQEARDGDCD